MIVGGDVADGRLRFERRVEDDDRDAGARRFFDRPDQRPGVERRQHDGADALALEALDDLDLLLAIVLVPTALFLPLDRPEKALLVASVLLVLIVELLNTAIEKLADRLTTEHDTQIGRVKDMGSAAVGVALIMAGLFWIFAIAERMGAL